MLGLDEHERLADGLPVDTGRREDLVPRRRDKHLRVFAVGVDCELPVRRDIRPRRLVVQVHRNQIPLSAGVDPVPHRDLAVALVLVEHQRSGVRAGALGDDGVNLDPVNSDLRPVPPGGRDVDCGDGHRCLTALVGVGEVHARTQGRGDVRLAGVDDPRDALAGTGVARCGPAVERGLLAPRGLDMRNLGDLRDGLLDHADLLLPEDPSLTGVRGLRGLRELLVDPPAVVPADPLLVDPDVLRDLRNARHELLVDDRPLELVLRGVGRLDVRLAGVRNAGLG